MFYHGFLLLLASALGSFVFADAACVLYQSGFANGFSDATGSWTPHHKTCDTKIKHYLKCSFSAALGAYTGLIISRHPSPKLSSFSSLDFWINGGPAGGQKLWAGIMVDTNKNYYRYTMNTLKANKWQHFNIPIKIFKAKGTGVLAFFIQDMSGRGGHTLYLDSVQLLGSTCQVAKPAPKPTVKPTPKPTPAPAAQPTPSSVQSPNIVYGGTDRGGWTHANSYKLAGGVTTVSDTRDGSPALQVAIEQFGALNFGFGSSIGTANFKGLSFDATSPSGSATVKVQVDPGDVTSPVFDASYTLSNSWETYSLTFFGNQGIFTNIEFVNLNGETTPNIWINNVVLLTSFSTPPAPPPASSPSSRESWAWVFTNWKSSIETIIANTGSFTHVSPTFYTVNYNYISGVPEFYTGSNNFGGMKTIDIAKKLVGVGISVVPAIFGGSGNQGVDQGMQNILDNANNAGTEFINSMVAEAQKNGYAGYNIDWEVHQSSSPIGAGYAKKFSNFLKQFKSALGDLSLSVDVIDSNIANTWCSGNNGFIDVLEVAPLVDRIVIEDYTSFLGDASANCDDTALGRNAVVPCTAIYDQKRSFSKFVNLMRCNNLSAEKIIIGMQADSDNNNPIADACVHTVLSHGFNKIALWPQPDGIYPYLSADGLVSDKKDWYAILSNFLTSQIPTRRLLSSPYDIMDGMAFVSGNGTVDASKSF